MTSPSSISNGNQSSTTIERTTGAVLTRLVPICGSCLSLYKRDLPSFADKKLDPFYKFGESEQFRSFIENAGLSGATFQANKEHLSPSSPLYQRFTESLWDSPDSSTVSVVFHGTSPSNIPIILKDGLDPNKRRGQAYGPGEYFSREPGLSVSYCKSGLQMLAFAVVELPQDTFTSAKRPKPPDYVVIENTALQFPLGVVSFNGADAKVQRRSSVMRTKLKKLNQEARNKAIEAEELKYKASLIQYIVNEKWDICERKWNQSKDTLSKQSRREISMFAHTKLQDDELISCLFPDMPPPMTVEEHGAWTNSKTVEAQEAEAQQAMQKMNEAQRAMQKVNEAMKRFIQEQK